MAIPNTDQVDLAVKRYKLAVEAQRTKFEKFNDYDFIFNSKLKKADPKTPSKVFNPIIWGFIETIITRMLAKTPIIAYKPREESDRPESNIFTELFSYWFDKAEVYPVMVKWVKSALQYGTALIKVDWYKSEPRTVNSYVLDPTTGEPVIAPDGTYLVQQSEVTDYDDPRIKNVNIYDFYIEPSAETVQGAEWVIYQYRTTIKELKNYPNYNQTALNRLQKTKATNGTMERDEFERRRKEAVGLNTNLLKDDTVDSVICWEMWSKGGKLTVIADGVELLYDGNSPYWHGLKPFIAINDSLVDQEFWGKGEIEPVEKVVHALNTIQNQRITNVNRILNPMWKATSNVDDFELQFEDNGIIHVTDINQDVEMLQIPNVTATAFQEAQALMEELQRALGVTDYVQGLQTPGQTATEVETKTAQANARFAHKVKLFEEMGLKQLGEMFYQLCQQYWTKQRIVRIVGRQGEIYQPVTTADLIGEYDVVPESDSTLAVDTNADFQKFINLFQLLQQYTVKSIPDPMTGQIQQVGYLSEEELLRELMNKSNLKDVDRFFVKTNDQTTQNETAAPGQPPQVGSGTLPPNLTALLGSGGRSPAQGLPVGGQGGGFPGP